jgi:hypothetical protein
MLFLNDQTLAARGAFVIFGHVQCGLHCCYLCYVQNMSIWCLFDSMKVEGLAVHKVDCTNNCGYCKLLRQRYCCRYLIEN